MLARESRLSLKNNKFIGKKIQTDEFTILYRNADKFRSAIVIPKRVAKKAVDRNRIKRLVAESLKDRNYNFEIVVKVKNNLSNLKKNDLETKLEKALGKLSE